MGLISLLLMVYVIRKEDGNIWIDSFLPVAVEADGEEEIQDPVLFVFPWFLRDIEPCIRWFILDPRGNEKVYVPEVLDYLETIKDLPNPPQEELIREYLWKEKIRAFNRSLEELRNLGVIQKDIEEKELVEGIYEIDLVSQLYRNYPESVVDTIHSWEDLDEETKAEIREVWKSPNSTKGEDLRKKDRIKKFLPISLILDREKNKNNPEPAYKNSEKVWENTEKDLVLEVVNKLKPGDEFTQMEFSDKYGKEIKILDLYKYFEITRLPRKGIYKIVRKLC